MADNAAPPANTPNNEAIKEKGMKLVEDVLSRVNDITTNGGFMIPPNYAVENAVRMAYFMIAETVDKDKKPATEVCTSASIAEAMFRMVMQGLDPGKVQCYFIVNGTKLSLRRSYLGSIAVSKRVANVDDCYGVVIHEDDTFEYEMINGKKKLIKHEQSFLNLDKPIIGAYAIATFTTGREQELDVMTYKEIKESWKMSQNQTNNKLQTQFGPEAAKRTVINRCLKPIINTSDDANMYQRDLREDTEVEDTTFETESSQPLAPTKTVALPPATPKVSVPLKAQPEPQPAAAPKAQAQEPPATLFADPEPGAAAVDPNDPRGW